jgi:antitoxin component of RelBE/YafQ-DinJ toxin-antitoxin module
MSKELNMPMSQCINMLVSKWLKDNKWVFQFYYKT